MAQHGDIGNKMAMIWVKLQRKDSLQSRKGHKEIA
jgi:hypothetical protein